MRNTLLFTAVLLAACVHETRTDPLDRSGYVDAARIVPGLAVDMRYAGENNFIGRRIEGYVASTCLLTREAAEALRQVQTKMNAEGLRLKVFDCYRPQRAVADFVAWAKDLGDQKRKAQHYPNVDKSKLFELGYIAERSGHSRGSTVDLTIVDARTGAELDMGSAYDLFDPVSWPSDTSVPAIAQRNRARLQEAMKEAGFRPLKEEWWHFTLEGEPYPDTYFDFPVTR